MVMIKDVAEKAGVSYGTISRVLNGHYDVSDQTREKILKCIQELGYVPNVTAQKLGKLKGRKESPGAQVKTNNVACILFANYNKFSLPYFTDILDGIDNELFKKGNQLFVYTAGQLNSNPSYFSKMINSENIDGLILINTAEMIVKVKDKIKAVVCVNCSGEGCDSIDVDREQGVYDAVKYLAGMGHRKIAFIGTGMHWNPIDKKFDGYRRALSESEIMYDENLVAGKGNGIDVGYEALKEIRARNVSPTAVFASSDMTAFGVMKAAGEMGLRIPDDISLVGYDDIEYSQTTNPPLTTVKVDRQYLGTLGVRRLFERISDPLMRPVKTIISPELVVRASCRKLSSPNS